LQEAERVVLAFEPATVVTEITLDHRPLSIHGPHPIEAVVVGYARVDRLHLSD
jgi:hypothetical protein